MNKFGSRCLTFLALTLVATFSIFGISFSRADAPSMANMFPFVMPPFDDSKTPTDLSWMNPTPAGANGFIRADGEHFVDGKGNVVRFWGVNLNFSGVFPPKNEAPGIAGRLAKFGFNAVRIHQFEGSAAPKGIWKPFVVGGSRLKYPREFDSDQLDRFDFFMSELMKRGIYLDLNLHVGRKTSVEDGIAQAGALPDKDKGVDYYDPKLIEAQRDFSRQLLTHVNPYTGRSYADEPGVCAVEMTNEDSLLGNWISGSFSKIPELYLKPLRDQWNDWLGTKYDESTLRAAWTELDDPLDPNDILTGTLPPGIINPNAPDSRMAIGMQVLNSFKFKRDSGAVADVDVDPLGGPTMNGFVRPGMSIWMKSLGSEKWGFQTNRDGLDLKDGQPYSLSFWARSSSPRRISVNLWQDRQPYDFKGFTGFADLTSEWQQYSFVFRPIEPDPGHTRLNFNFGNALGTIQLGEMTLQAGGRLAAPANWTLARGVPLIELRTTQVWNARRDFAKFLGGIEAKYVEDMRRFLKDDIKVRCPIWNTQAQFGGWGGVWRESASDAIDIHAYWKHPIFSGGGWDGNSWKVENASMTKAPGIDPLSGFSLYRLKGKPFVMTEWNSGQPNDFGAEALPMIAAYGAWQDWAAIYLFDYHSSGPYNRDVFSGFFSIDAQPAKMATAPAAALAFRRPATAQNEKDDDKKAILPGDAKGAWREYVLSLPSDTLWLKVANSSGQPTPALVLPTWRDGGAPRGAALRGKTYVEFKDTPMAAVNRSDRDPLLTFYSDTREVTWNKTPGYFSLNSPRSKIATGFLGGYGLTLGAFKLNVPMTGNGFGSYALSSLDGLPVEHSKDMLLTAVGRAENIGMGWNSERNSVGSAWGSGPTLIEGMAVNLELVTTGKNPKVFALGPTGVRAREIPSALRHGRLYFSISPSYKSVWYEIVVE